MLLYNPGFVLATRETGTVKLLIVEAADWISATEDLTQPAKAINK